MRAFKPDEVEASIRAYWRAQHVRERLTERAINAKPFTFIDGPPYTSGKVHVGTAWNKSLKDMVLRFKRMQGFAVFDRAGYDMHGLPTEHAVMKKLGLHTNEDIERFGYDNFTRECREWCLTTMRTMNADFEKLGVWMDFENAYQPITREFTNGVWHLIATAHKNGRLYEGLRPMAWDPVFQTACAKHELIYETVVDQSIYVKFRVLHNGKQTNEHLIIWTTTPWTIPWNLAIMVHPDVEYVKAKIGNEVWIIAADRASALITDRIHEEFTILETFKGSKIVGVHYEHPLASIVDFAELKKKHPNIHTVVASTEYVDTVSGSGLVHCAPGCGPEDYEVGIAHNLPPWNLVGGDGSFPAPFEGLKARTDDASFIRLLEEHGAIAAKERYTHEYAHSERSKAPIIYKTTTQWFFKVSDLRPRMLEAIEQMQWQPESAYNAFRSWIENLRDNSITKQRFWGTPVPIWRNTKTGEILVISSLEELETLSGVVVADQHKPFIDEITIPSQLHPGTVLTRIPDVLDVWVDAGSASWNALDYPANKLLIQTHFPADFILEGRDQIRGWFNLMLVAGYLAFDAPSFQSVYLHGFINDAQGRKMSKSLGNYIVPEEVLPLYGVDAFRAYMIGATAPGLDLNYNIDDLANTAKNLNVLWNTVQYFVELCEQNDLTPSFTATGDEEERYLLSRMASVTKAATEALNEYHLPTIPRLAEQFYLEISRTYIQLVREKAAGEEKQLVADTLYTTLTRVLTLFAPVAPFITEALWQDINRVARTTGSVHEQLWPSVEVQLLDEELESVFATVQQCIGAGLACREKLKLGIRWPLAKAVIMHPDTRLHAYEAILKRHLNVKNIYWNDSQLSAARIIKPNFGTIAKTYAKDTSTVARLISEHKPHAGQVIEGFVIHPEHMSASYGDAQGYALSAFNEGAVYLSEERSEELIEEGYARELLRKVQSLRKDLGLQKRDKIELHIGGAHSLSHNHLADIAQKTNATLVANHIGEPKAEHIKERTYSISAQKTI